MARAKALGDGWLSTPGTEPRGSGLAMDCDRGGHSMRSREGQRGKDRRMQREGNKTEGYKGGEGRGRARQVDSETSHREGSDPKAGLGKSRLRTKRDRLDSRGEGRVSYPGAQGPAGREALGAPRCPCSHLWIQRTGPHHSPPGQWAAFVPYARPPWRNQEVGGQHEDQIPSTRGWGHPVPPGPALPSQLIISVPRIFCPVVLSFWK